MSRTSIVILTYNRRDEALRCVAAALALPERPPVIVVDNGSPDGTAAAIAARFPEVELVRTGANLGAAGRNLGVARARTPYVAFCDDDTFWEPGSIEVAETLFDCYPRVAVFAARVLVGDDGREDPAMRTMAASPLPSDGLPGRALLGFMAGACVVRRRAFLEAGGYERRFMIGGEEELLACDLAMAGWQLVYVESLVVRHFPSPSRDSRRRRRALARNALWVAWLRRPARIALRTTLRALARREGLLALVDALAELAWVLRERRVIPPQLERWRRALDNT